MLQANGKGSNPHAVERYWIAAVFVLGLLVATSIADSLSTFAFCGRADVIEMNPLFDDPCAVFEWEIFWISLALWVVAASLLAFVVFGGSPLCTVSDLKRFRTFLLLVGWGNHKCFEARQMRLALFWGTLMFAVGHTIATISNLLVLMDLPSLYGPFNAAFEMYGLQLSRTHTYLLWHAVRLPLLVLIAQWATWKLLRLNLRLVGKWPENAAIEPAERGG